MEEKHEYRVVAQKFSPRGAAIYGEGYDIEERTLEKIGAKLVIVDTTSETGFIEAAKNADALISYGGGLQFNRTIIDSLQNCKIIAVPAVGFDRVDIAAASERGIWVTNVPDIFIDEVADHAMMLIWLPGDG